MGDNSIFVRSFLQAVKNTDYFSFIPGVATEARAEELLRQNKVQFIISIPPNFTQQLVRNKRPQILVEADATDPVSVGNALAAITNLAQTAWQYDLSGPLAAVQAPPSTVDLIIHERYNPLRITQYNIVPGLLGVVLTMTMVIITSLAMTREREHGTMENLLAMPLQPLEIMIGKIVPYISIGYIQVVLILLAARFLFYVPFSGHISLLLLACLPFIAANLAVGLTFSTFASNQLQAVQGGMFFFLPSLLLSGFLFPFLGMPLWAQYLGKLLPLSHFVLITRGILLKGNGLTQIWPNIWPVLLFTVFVILIGLKRFRRTLD
jgi:ABC-2 type transport system permease protein